MTLTRDAIIGFVVLALIALGCIWYVASHPTPTGTNEVPTGTAVGPQHITDTQEFYTVDAQYPGSTILKTSVDADTDVNAVALMKQWELDTVAEFKKSFTDLGADYEAHLREMNQKGSLAITYKTYQSKQSVSYEFDVYQDTLGAHPNGFYHTFSFDTKTGNNLALHSIFESGTNYLGYLSATTRAQLPAMIASRENVDVSQINMDMLNDGTAPTEDNFANFYLDGSDFVILFPPYQIGPYVLGSTEFHLPLATLPGLKAEYK